MATLQIDIPDELASKLTAFASQQNVPVEQFAAAALSEFVLALTGEEVFRTRALRGSRQKFLVAMAKVPSVPPIPPDKPAR